MVIEGFKSYKDQTIIEPFSRNINVVGEGLVCCTLAMQKCTIIPLSAKTTVGLSQRADMCRSWCQRIGKV